MNVLWLCNVPIPRATNVFSIKGVPTGGWLISVADEIEKMDDVNLSIMFINNVISKGINCKQDKGISFIGVNWDNDTDLEKINIMKEVIKKIDPDVIHIWGTEGEHSYYMSVAAKELGISSKVVVSIQGLVSMYTYHYMNGLPWSTQCIPTFRDIIRKDTLLKQKNTFYKNGGREKKTINNVANVIGRTFWDEYSTKMINPNITYYFNNETLRESFYENEWNVDKYIKHRIFVSQAQYPIKGFHFLLEAVAMLKKEYPDISVVVGGRDNTFKKGLLITAYGKYIDKLIKRNNLEENIKYVGMLSEKEMVQAYLDAEVFVSASSIENSPNSVAEAMLLGMPVVSSNVGGVADMLVHNQEGFLYQSDAPYLLAHYIKRFFESDELKIEMGRRAKLHAHVTHDKDKNVKQLVNIYTTLKKRSENE